MALRIEEEGSAFSVKSWVRGSLLGAGAFGQVNLALNTENGELFAVKSVECSVGLGSREADYVAIQNEKHILQSLESPFVISCLGSDWSVENGKSVCNIFLEYVPGGSLTDLMKKFGGRLNEQLIRTYTKGILQGLQYIHGQGVVHCDIKGKNVLVGSSGIKLADFGCAKRVTVGEDAGSSTGEFLGMMKGTPLWMAPEVVRQEEQGAASDIWSLGCTIVEMATGRAPWSCLCNLADHFVALYHIGCSGEVPDLPAFLSADAKDFLDKCFCRDPRNRWTSTQLLRHPFVTEPLPPHQAPKEAPASPKSVLELDIITQEDRDWESQTFTCGKSNTQKESQCDSAAASKSGNWWGWGSSALSPPAEKWIVVHSCSPHSPLLCHRFSNFATQPRQSVEHSTRVISKEDPSRHRYPKQKIHTIILNKDVTVADLFHMTRDETEPRGGEDCCTLESYPSSGLRINVAHAMFSCREAKLAARIK